VHEEPYLPVSGKKISATASNLQHIHTATRYFCSGFLHSNCVVPGVLDSNVLKLKTKSFNYSLFNPCTLNCIPGSFSQRVILLCVGLVHCESHHTDAEHAVVVDQKSNQIPPFLSTTDEALSS
jgi:hypothetical protein